MILAWGTGWSLASVSTAPDLLLPREAPPATAEPSPAIDARLLLLPASLANYSIPSHSLVNRAGQGLGFRVCVVTSTQTLPPCHRPSLSLLPSARLPPSLFRVKLGIWGSGCEKQRRVKGFEREKKSGATEGMRGRVWDELPPRK